MRQYKGSRRVIAIWAINNFTVYRILNVRIGVSFDSYRHYITNNFEQLIEEKGLEIISIITTPILVTIGIHIGSTGFLEADVPEMVFNIDGKIVKRLVIVEGVCAKLIFSRCVGLN